MENKAFLTVEEVAAEMGVSKSYAYKIVKKLNEELQQMGYLTDQCELFSQKGMLHGDSLKERR